MRTVVMQASLRAAVAAPSLHNSQPWQFHCGQRSVDLIADMSRHLPVIDPDGRELMMSLGAALLNLRVGMRATGYAPLVRRLPGEPYTAARVTIGPYREATPSVAALERAITRRRTSRSPFKPVAVPAAVIDELVTAAVAEGARLELLGPTRRDAVLALTQLAEQALRKNHAYRRELAAWTTWRQGRPDGLPPAAFGYVDRAKALPVRDFRQASPAVGVRRAVFEVPPRLLLLCTRGDGPDQWLRAGQAMERVWLSATVRGLALQPMSQALEDPDLRRLVLGDDSDGWHPQMLMRIGYGRPAPATPRRATQAVLV